VKSHPHHPDIQSIGARQRLSLCIVQIGGGYSVNGEGFIVCGRD